MTRLEILKILLPDFFKRRKIKSLVAEYNLRIRLRNQAYDLAFQEKEIVNNSHEQSGESLDRTIDFLERNIDFLSNNDYQTIIEENKKKRQRKLELLKEEEERNSIVTL